MGVVIYCRGCGYGHDNLKSCELARLEREREACLIADAAEKPVEKTGWPVVSPDERYLAQEARSHATGRRRKGHAHKPKPSVPGADLEARLAATEKRLAEIREKARARTAKWRSGKRAKGS